MHNNHITETRDDSSIGKSMGKPVIMLNAHNQPNHNHNLPATYMYLLAEVVVRITCESCVLTLTHNVSTLLYIYYVVLVLNN